MSDGNDDLPKHAISGPQLTCAELEANAKSPVSAHTEWKNWGITDVATTPAGRLCTSKTFRPTNVHELAAAIRQAEDEGKRVRATGSGFSLSELALPQIQPVNSAFPPLPAAFLEPFFGYAIDCTGFASSLHKHLGGLLHGAATPDDFFLVEAGITIRDLNTVLDHESPRRALASLGGADAQTLGGALATSTHGGDVALGPIGEAVQALYMVGAKGRHVWIERSARVTTAGSVCKTFPCIKDQDVFYDDQRFNAALVNLGGMGVTYAVLLKTVPQFCLLTWNRTSTWEWMLAAAGADLAKAIDGSWSGINHHTEKNFPNAKNRFVQILINPMKRADGTHLCFVTNRVEVPMTQPSGSPPVDLSSVADNEISAAIQSAPEYDVWHHGAKLLGIAHAVQSFQAANPKLSRGPTLIYMIRLLKREGFYWAVRELVSLLMSRVLPASSWCDAIPLPFELPETLTKPVRQASTPRIDLGYRIMTQSIVTGVSESEVAATGTEPAFAVFNAVSYITSMLKRFDNGVVAGGRYPVGYLSLRLCGPTSASMGMQEHSPTASVEVAMIRHNPVFQAHPHHPPHPLTQDIPLPQALLALTDDGWGAECEAEAISRGARLHWGQANGQLTHLSLINAYGSGKLTQWQKVRVELGGNTFINLFLERTKLA